MCCIDFWLRRCFPRPWRESEGARLSDHYERQQPPVLPPLPPLPPHLVA